MDWKRMLSASRAAAMLVAVMAGAALTPADARAQSAKPDSAAAARQIPKGKQTTLGLYVTAAQAYAMWKASPERVKIIDVRTPEEYALIGHPEMAWNVPFAFISYQRKEGTFEYQAVPNTAFVALVKEIATPTDTLLIACRSGGRGAKAVNKLAEAGFLNSFNITDGIEGDVVEDPESVFFGKRMKNGWKNSAPWVYGVDPEKIIIESLPSE